LLPFHPFATLCADSGKNTPESPRKADGLSDSSEIVVSLESNDDFTRVGCLATCFPTRFIHLVLAPSGSLMSGHRGDIFGFSQQSEYIWEYRRNSRNTLSLQKIYVLLQRLHTEASLVGGVKEGGDLYIEKALSALCA